MNTLHVGVAKNYLRSCVETSPSWWMWLPEFEGTRAEALAAIDADPREIFCSCACEKSADGACTGRRSCSCPMDLIERGSHAPDCEKA